jgi:hypothetical protein
MSFCHQPCWASSQARGRRHSQASGRVVRAVEFVDGFLPPYACTFCALLARSVGGHCAQPEAGSAYCVHPCWRRCFCRRPACWAAHLADLVLGDGQAHQRTGQAENVPTAWGATTSARSIRGDQLVHLGVARLLQTAHLYIGSNCTDSPVLVSHHRLDPRLHSAQAEPAASTESRPWRRHTVVPL